MPLCKRNWELPALSCPIDTPFSAFFIRGEQAINCCLKHQPAISTSFFLLYCKNYIGFNCYCWISIFSWRDISLIWDNLNRSLCKKVLKMLRWFFSSTKWLMGKYGRQSKRKTIKTSVKNLSLKGSAEYRQCLVLKKKMGNCQKLWRREGKLWRVNQVTWLHLCQERLSHNQHLSNRCLHVGKEEWLLCTKTLKTELSSSCFADV